MQNSKFTLDSPFPEERVFRYPNRYLRSDRSLNKESGATTV